jgi:ketosteroid isomerase-like protein
VKDANSDAAIRRIIDARTEAINAGDVDAMGADVADDIVTFDVVKPLRSLGKAGSRKRANEWLANYDGRPRWENRDVTIVADGDVAFSHALSHVTGTLKTGTAVDMWLRTTLGFRRISGRWLIVHDHGSDPFDPETGKASLDLKP